MKRSHRFILFVDNFKNKKIYSKNKLGDILLYVQGRGDINIANDGMHSDFFGYSIQNFHQIMLSYHQILTKNKLSLKAKYKI